ncbi:hypothetical protein B296_00039595 [Ensete ventricosum]|uniref:Secreted protein n=1 Tax=Ensete ventricosum TaxID=4639 RepID=A0A426XS53_ENSVE|nr:hypothetical protein B296_00039595 [Ensete ventricosum]
MLQWCCLFVASLLRCYSGSTSLPLRCNAAMALPHCHLAVAMLQQHRVFAAVILLFPFDATAACQVSLHFFSSFYVFFFLLPFSFHLYSSTKPSSSTSFSFSSKHQYAPAIPCVGTPVQSGTARATGRPTQSRTNKSNLGWKE